MAESGHLRRDHRPLTFIEVPTLQIERQNVSECILAGICLEGGLPAGRHASSVAIAPVEYLAVERHDRNEHALRPHVFDQCVELGALQQGKEVCKWIKVKARHAARLVLSI